MRIIALILSAVLVISLLTSSDARVQATSCTHIYGYSQVGNASNGGWFYAFEDAVNDAEWEMSWRSGARVNYWADPNYAGWTEPTISECGAATRIVFSVAPEHWDTRTVEGMRDDILAVLDNIRDKHPGLPIVLMPIVGGPAHAVCGTYAQQSNGWDASDGHLDIEAALALVSAIDSDWTAGPDVTVSSCSRYKDFKGHLTSAGATEAGLAYAAAFGGGSTPTPTPTSVAPTATNTPTSPTSTPAACGPMVITSTSDTDPAGGGTVSISWEAVPGATKYVRQRIIGGQLGSGTKETTSLSFTESDHSTDASFRMWAVCGSAGPYIEVNP